MRKSLVLVSMLSLSLFGTACAARYEARTTSLAAPTSMAAAATADTAFEAAWWRQFEDPALDSLVEQAFSANRDLQAAAARYTPTRNARSWRAGGCGVRGIRAGRAASARGITNSVDAYAAANREFAAHERRAQAAAHAAGVLFVQYREGLVDSLARTQADRDAIAGALDANRALTAQRLAVVDVYRALGGGWR